jgi:hypothetical protein
LHRDAFGGGFDTGGAPNGLDQRVAVMRTRAAHQRPVNVEQHQR